MFSRRTLFMLIIALAAGIALAASQPALGYSYGVHHIATQRAVDVMQIWGHMQAINGTDDRAAQRAAAGVHFYPALTNNGSAMSYALVDAAKGYDEYAGEWGTRNHFWTADEDLDECPEGIVGVDNAWEVARTEWLLAINAARLGQSAQAMFNLGHVLHLVEDLGQPAHTNSDLHGPWNRDSLEEWGGYDIIDPLYSWTDPSKTSPGRIFLPPSKQAIIQRVRERTAWAGRDEFFADTLLSNPDDPANTAQLFWIMYVTNQWSNYFASDGESGNKTVRLGWVDYEALGFPAYLHRYGAYVSAQSESALDDNEGGCGHPGSGDEYCNADYDLSTIAKWGYAASMKGCGGIIELFRRTVDNAPPVTAVTLTRNDGQPCTAGSWNDSPVTVRLSNAVDSGSLGFPIASGVWTLYGLVNGQEWAPNLVFPISQLQKTFTSSGTNTVQVRSTDNAGNTEQRDVLVRVDLSPPAITFPGWRDWYHECETVTANWTVVEPHSGLKYSAGRISATPVVKDKPIPRYLLILGQRTLSVTAKDNAGNAGSAQRTFEIRGHDGPAIGKPQVAPVGALNLKLYQISGALAPQHYTGTTPITLWISKRVTSSYAMARMVPAEVQADGRYSATVAMAVGEWKVCAKHSYPTMTSEYTDFRVQ